ncbi:MAG: hypothetical protein J0M02_11740 [Planctomycetes bacterium]|nr:hypothetical protein [Planctomycetota bacterium]
MHTLLRHLLLLACLLPAWALDLTVTGSFTTNEDVPLVFSYSQLLAKCTVSATPDRVILVSVAGDGVVQRGMTNSGPWTNAAADDVITSGMYLRYTPNENYFGTTTLMNFRVGLDAAVSGSRAIDAAILSVNDPPVAASCLVDDLTEDTPRTWTYSDLITLLGISDVESDPFRIVVTQVVSGSASLSVGQYLDEAGDSITWTPAANVFTRDYEPDITALRFRVDSVGVAGQSAVVAVTTRVSPVQEDDIADPTTLTSFDTLRAVKGSMVEYTYDQLWRKCRGMTDIDRSANIRITWEISPCEGAQLVISESQFNTSNTFDLSLAAMPLLVAVDPYDSLRIVLPATAPTGLRTLGNVRCFVQYSSGLSEATPLRLQVDDLDSGNADTDDSEGGDSGGCGGGLTGCLIAYCLIAVGLRRRHA